MVRRPNCLPHFADADRAGLDVGLELLSRALAPARADVAEVRRRQATRKRSLCGDALSAAIVLVSRWPDTFSATSITLMLSESIIATMRLIASGVRDVAGMPVHVDGRELGLRHLVLGHHQRVARAVVEDARRRFRRRLQLPGRTSVVPGGHSWPGVTRVPPPRCAASTAPIGAADQDDENGSKESHGILILTRTSVRIRGTEPS